MKRFIGFFAVLFALVIISCEYSSAEQARRRAASDAVQAQTAAQASVTVPLLTYFQERRTVAKWATHWDKPSAECYVYLVSYGTIIGYYVSDGKPAATTSYITPTARITGVPSAPIHEFLPDLDGTFGDNNPGIRFFTASGIAVEWGGQGATYIYSDAPLALNVPLLGQ